MRPEEAVLFVIVTVLSFALVAAVVAPLVRKKRAGALGRAVSSIAGFVTPDGLEGPRCPTCRRGLLPDFHFCPFDGTPLLSGGPAIGRAPAEGDRSGGVPRKVCPRCARAYVQDTTVCAHDGAPLVPLGPLN